MPDQKWRPAGAPEVVKDFNKAVPGPKPTPVSLKEKQQLESERAKPAPALKPREPGGAQQNVATVQQAKDREARIKDISQRLAAKKDQARTAFDKNRGRG